MYEKVEAQVELMKKKYPKELNMDGLEPALTTDILEIVEYFLKARDEELMEDMKVQMSEWHGNGKLMVEDYQANLIKNNEKI